MPVFDLYKEVQLTKDLPESGFIKGDVATIVDTVVNKNGETGYCLEFFDTAGKTLDVITVDADTVQKPIAGGVVHYREFVH